ncbi:hypothetical protein [Paucisalibacillus globulus]|uniref:hypothetical protein n=1 Tax=Paucisalibacillus globulus TaxID=351095 RepID=UPI00047D79E0|nr:hypothetical protein [Paucisalibacillus globulus]
MYKRTSLLIICLVILSGCMNAAAYNDEDVAAIVRGEEITVGYMRLLYPDEEIANMVEEAVKAKLAEQEVKKMKVDVSKQIEQLVESYGQYPKEETQSIEAQSIRAFADPQAEKLGMDPNEYYKKYTEISTEMVGYINAYTTALLGELEEDQFGIEEYAEHANQLFEDLVEQNQDSIEIKIK